MTTLKQPRTLINVRHGNNLRLVDNDSIVYCEAVGNYSKIVFSDCKSILVAKTLKIIEETLPDNCFSRINKKYLININQITEIRTSNKCIVLMNGNTELIVSVRMKKKLMKILHDNFHVI